VSRWSGNIRRLPPRVVYVPDLPPKVVDKYLMPSERIVTTVRMHPIAIFAPVILILAGLFVAVFVTRSAHPGSGGFVGFIWILWGVLVAWQGWKIVTWWRRYFVVTENRLMLITSLIVADVGMMPLAKVTDMRLHQGSLGRALGYATFIVESAGQEQALSRIEFVPYPSSMYQEILALIFPKRPAAAGPQGPPGPPPGSPWGPTGPSGPPPGSPEGPTEPPSGSPQEPQEAQEAQDPTEPPPPDRPSWPSGPGWEPPDRPGDDPGF
jgi:membrane protein YdbS with pleckstrin-like domain